MVFMKTGLQQDPSIVISGQGVTLRPLASGDYRDWVDIRTRSREHLVPWEPAWPRDDLCRSAFRRRLRHSQRDMREDLGYAFVIVETATGRLSGGVTLSNVRRGVTQAASLGYWLGVDCTGRGIMTRSVNAVLSFAFDELGLHRIEAACMPENRSSIGVLERCGFQREGLARKYLKINGAWHDHVMFSLLAEDREVVREKEIGAQ